MRQTDLSGAERKHDTSRMDAAQQPIVVGVGELLWDCFDGTRRPGGAPANVAYHASQLGSVGAICSRVGLDEAGDVLTDTLADRGLSVANIQRDATHPTGHVSVDASDPDAPTYTIHENTAWDHLELTDAWAELFARASCVCFGTLAQRSDRTRATIRECVAAATGGLIVYDVNLRPPWYERSWIESSLAAADVVKLNIDELPIVANLVGISQAAPPRFCEAIIDAYDVRIVCVTRGGNGCCVASKNEAVECPGKQIEVADAVGAGDAFTAAFIHGVLAGWPLAVTADFANDVGALIATREGAMPDIREDYARLLHRIRAQSASDGSL
jgi:fructokinase